MLQLSKLTFFVCISSCLMFACQPEENNELVVITEEAIYLSGERAKLSGRIYENNGSLISQHGFEISTAQNFDSFLSVELGVKDNKGQFIGEFTNLDVNTDYWYRAYMVVDGGIVYGVTKIFKTLTVSVSSFEPKFAYPGETVVIKGANFSSNTKVYFGENEATILNIDLESFITVEVPAIGVNPNVEITVIVGDELSKFETNFEYIYGEWIVKQEFVNNDRFFQSLSMTTQNSYIFGLGKKFDATNSNSTLYHLDLNLNQWTELPFTGSSTTYPFQNSAGYFGGGSLEWSFQSAPVMTNEFWHFENGTLVNLGELPFSVYKGVSYFYNNEVYVFGGLLESGDRNREIFRYNTASGEWSHFGNVPIGIDATLPHFFINSIGYFISTIGEIWSYDFVANSWSQIGKFPSTSLKEGGIFAVINGKAYIGLFPSDRRIWEYTIATNTWKQKAEFTGYLLDKTSGYYVHDGKFHVIRMSRDANGEDMKIWEFDPEKF